MMFGGPSFAEKCKPHFVFVHGLTPFWDLPNLKETYNAVEKPFHSAGIRTEFHTHFQREDDGEHIGKCVNLVRFRSLVVSGICAAVPGPWCLLPFGRISLGCIVADFVIMGDLEKSLTKRLEEGVNPIVIVGHSWGGDTAYEFARNHLPALIEKHTHKPGVVLVTLDAVGKKGKYNRTDLPNNTTWINVHLGKKRSGCGSEIVDNWAKKIKSVPYTNQSNANFNIHLNKRILEIIFQREDVEYITHCDTDTMFYSAQKYITSQIQKVCGSDYSIPKGDLNHRKYKDGSFAGFLDYSDYLAPIKEKHRERLQQIPPEFRGYCGYGGTPPNCSIIP